MIEESLFFVANMLAYAAGVVAGIAVRVGSYFSIWALSAAFMLALVWYQQTSRRKRSIAKLAKLLLPRGYMTGKSARADWLLLLLGHTVFIASFFSALVSLPLMTRTIAASLALVSGASTVIALDPMGARIATTVLGFIAYEFAYFLDHLLVHKVKFLWEFHKVHHTATTLSPITLARMHPVDAWLNASLSTAIVGSTLGLCLWLFGPGANPFTVDGVNIVLFVGVFTIMALQHSHVWIPFRGRLGRTLLGPAHHQLHHSANPEHFNSNYGNILAFWDRLFGTLREPPRKSPRLRFGVDEVTYDPHSLQGLLLNPFADAAKHLAPKSPDLSDTGRPATDKL